MAFIPRELRRMASTALLIGFATFAAQAGEHSPTEVRSDPAIGPVTKLPLPRFVSMRAESANARRGPSLDQRVDWEFVRRGMPLRVTAEYGNWRRVEDSEGFGGWVHHILLSGVRTVLVTGEEVTPLLEEARLESRILAEIEPGVVAHVAACAGPWCEIAAGGLQGWIERSRLWGVDPDEIID